MATFNVFRFWLTWSCRCLDPVFCCLNMWWICLYAICRVPVRLIKEFYPFVNCYDIVKCTWFGKASIYWTWCFLLKQHLKHLFLPQLASFLVLDSSWIQFHECVKNQYGKHWICSAWEFFTFIPFHNSGHTVVDKKPWSLQAEEATN